MKQWGRIPSFQSISAMAEARAYPKTAEIKRLVAAAKASGIDVAGIEISPRGHLRLLEERAIPKPLNDFDRYQDEL